MAEDRLSFVEYVFSVVYGFEKSQQIIFYLIISHHIYTPLEGQRFVCPGSRMDRIALRTVDLIGRSMVGPLFRKLATCRHPDDLGWS